MACLQAKPEDAGRKQRDADDVAKHRAILVPPDRGAGRVFSDKNLLKRAGRDGGKAFRTGAKPGQKSGMSSVLVSPPSLKS
jgi:hypothetical protein